MIKDAHLTQDDIADSVSILSVTFITLQPFSTAIGRRIGPKYWIACMMLAWGTVCMAHAATKNRGTLIALRLLLGAFEAGFVPTSFVRILKHCPSCQLAKICSITCRQYIRSTPWVSVWAYSQACILLPARSQVSLPMVSFRSRTAHCTTGSYCSSSKGLLVSSWPS
jgi:sugar phosphate permease